MTTLRVGSSISTTGGKVAVGRNIYDSFAIVYPHEFIRDHPVIVGDGGGRYTGRSGALGGAVANNLSAYVNQSVRYDVLNAPPATISATASPASGPPTRAAPFKSAAPFVSALGPPRRQRRPSCGPDVRSRPSG